MSSAALSADVFAYEPERYTGHAWKGLTGTNVTSRMGWAALPEYIFHWLVILRPVTLTKRQRFYGVGDDDSMLAKTYIRLYTNISVIQYCSDWGLLLPVEMS